MSNTPHGEESTGKFVRVCQGLPPVEVDCSGAETDLPEDRWSTGRFVSVAEAVPPIEVDCSACEAGPARWLELVVSFEDATPPARVLEHTNRLIRLVAELDPALGLTYDFARSRAEGEDVVIALAPGGANGVEERLEELLRLVESKLRGSAGARRTVARLGRAA